MVLRIVIFTILPLMVLASLILTGRAVPVTNKDVVTPTPISRPLSLSQPQLISPKSGEVITGPLVIRGYVPKSWTFEGQFVMQLLDADRRTILEAAVPVEWDNENTKNVLYFVESYNYHTRATSGSLVLKNDNPSGLPENQKSIEIPVSFAKPQGSTVYLFQYDSEEDKKICDCVACQVVLPVPVSLPVTKTPIKDTLNILAGRMHPKFYVKDINLRDSVLSVEFPDIDGFTSGGSCAQRINSLQVTKTAKQFPEVESVRFLPETMFQP